MVNCSIVSFVPAPFRSWPADFGQETISSIITVLLTHVRNENIEMLGGLRKGNKVVYKKFFLTRKNQYRSVCTLLAAG